jgi:hypothetical protein
MNAKSTLILLGVALLLFTYIYVFERHVPDPAREAEQATRLFPGLEPAGIQRIEVVRSNQVIRAERVGGRWRLTHPVYPAQPQAIEPWIQALQSATRRITLSAVDLSKQGAEPAALGLDPGVALVQVEHQGGRFHFRLGYRTPVGERVYIQMIGASDVHVTESALLDLLPNTVGDWRDHRFVDLATIPFNRLRVSSGAREYELEFIAIEQRWRLVRPRPARADGARIERALQQMQALRVERFVQDAPGADLEPYGLHEPALELSLLFDTNQVFSAQFGRSPPDNPELVFARRSDYPNVVLLSRAALETMAVPYTQFLDYRLVDQSIDRANRIEVQAVESFVLERQATGGWRVTEPNDFATDPALIQAFLKRFQALRIAEVAKEVVSDLDLPNYGLAAPSRQYRLLVAHEAPVPSEPLIQLDFGATRADRIFVRRADENPVYLTGIDDVLFLPRQAFELRERRLWQFDTNQVERIRIHLHGRDHNLLRGSGGNWTFAPGSQGIINTFALEETVHRLGQLWARAWVAQNPADLELYGFPQVNHRLEIQLNAAADGRVFQVAFGARSPSGGPFGLVDLESGATVFEFPFEIYHVYEDVIRSLSAPLSAAP